MGAADWNPDQYRKFAAERGQPFHDLLGLVQPAEFRQAVDLGCGPGDLTAAAAATLQTRHMIGIDNSPAMIAAAAARVKDGVTFIDGDIGQWTSSGDVDLVLASTSCRGFPITPPYWLHLRGRVDCSGRGTGHRSSSRSGVFCGEPDCPSSSLGAGCSAQTCQRVAKGETNMRTGLRRGGDHDVSMEPHEALLAAQGIGRADKGGF